MKKGVFRFRICAIMITVSIIAISLFILGAADGEVPGSEGDPIVTLSYVEKKIEQIKYYIDSNLNISRQDIDKIRVELAQKDKEIEDLKQKVENSLTFKVVEMSKGQVLLSAEGAEIIIRSGKATAIYGQLGGLSDITSAKDLKNGEALALNHMLIASRGDGRGVKAESGVFLIIKGSYTLK